MRSKQGNHQAPPYIWRRRPMAHGPLDSPRPGLRGVCRLGDGEADAGAEGIPRPAHKPRAECLLTCAQKAGPWPPRLGPPRPPRPPAGARAACWATCWKVEEVKGRAVSGEGKVCVWVVCVWGGGHHPLCPPSLALSRRSSPWKVQRPSLHHAPPLTATTLSCLWAKIGAPPWAATLSEGRLHGTSTRLLRCGSGSMLAAYATMPPGGPAPFPQQSPARAVQRWLTFASC